ncbi:MAG TPA: tetratricopeptide repeat protein, partial [Pyrinomonadaceae bacterium]
TISAILTKEPLPLARYSTNVPEALEWVVRKALRKGREERYQGMKEMLNDLSTLRQQVEFEAALERSNSSSSGETRATSSGGQHGVKTTAEPGAEPSAERTATETKPRSRRAVIAVAAAALLALTVAVAYFAYSRYYATGGAGAIRSIAVLPFANTGNNPDAEYLSDGISESLINSLSQLPGVKVIARSSSFKYKGKEVDPQEVARTLSVAGILTGRVAQRGDNLLISVELVDARDKTQVWGEQYNRKATDLLAVQAEISREIAEKLRLRLTAGEQKQLARRETVNPQAYELLLKGRFYQSKGGTENRKKAVELFQQAIAVDPSYALAYATLSSSYSRLVNNNLLDPKEYLPRAEDAARRALELDEGLAQAHLAMAHIKSYAWDWAAAEREHKRAIELSPNLAAAHSSYFFYLGIRGRYEQAIVEAKLARELDPLSPDANAAVVYGLILAHQYDQAIEAAKKLLEQDRSNPEWHDLLGGTYAAKGQYTEAIAAYQEAIRLGDDSPDLQVVLGAAYAKAGEREKAQAILKRLETGKEYISPFGLAILQAALGEREQALASLERAYAAHDQQLVWLGVEDGLDPLRPDPRFQDLMRRVGLAA